MYFQGNYATKCFIWDRGIWVVVEGREGDPFSWAVKSVPEEASTEADVAEIRI